MELILASNNKGKIAEFERILGEIGVKVLSLEQIGLDIEVVEDKDTFIENAIKKATEICDICNKPVLADDSGLEVDYLGGAPGVYSARFSAPNPTTQKNNQKLLEMLKGVPKEKRTARFVCTLALAFPDGRLITTRGECEGIILEELQGEEGFGFDPLFFYPPFNKSFAQLDKDVKNSVSHRGIAIRNLRDEIEKIIKSQGY